MARYISEFQTNIPAQYTFEAFQQYLASEGYLYQMQHKGPIDIDKVISDYKDLIGFWKKMYLK